MRGIVTSNKFVILDRDGTINIEKHYLSDPNQIELLPSAGSGMRRMQEYGLGLLVVTNQSAIGRGYFDDRRLEQIHERLRKLLSEEGVQIEAFYYCPHIPDDECRCRKPEPGMIEMAVEAYGFQPDNAVVIGDKLCDIELGQRVGATTILVGTGYGRETHRENIASPDYFVADLSEAADLLCGGMFE